MYDLVIIGAGAAGIGAAKAATKLGLSFIVVEASHRVGGRGYTERPTAEIAFDLGCHWLHGVNKNPLTQLPDVYKMEVTTDQSNWGFFQQGQWLGAKEEASFDEFEATSNNAIEQIKKTNQDQALFETYDQDNRWAPFLNYWISLNSSTDPDLVSARDCADFEIEDMGGDWPVKQGLGALLTRFANDIPVQLNSAVGEIDSSGKHVIVKTVKGDIEAKSVIVTVSTGVLNAQDIRFKPSLPVSKQEAINNLQLGNHNRICLIYDRDVFPDYQNDSAVCLDGEEPPLYFEISPFGLNYAVGSTGGRFADWLERVGPEASVDYAKEKLKLMFGSDVVKHIQSTVVTAWRGDPWIKGAYSVVTPGAYGARQQLAQSTDNRIYFAGEATSPNYCETVHGAYVSGVRSALQVADHHLGASHHNPEDLAWLLASPSENHE